jgi:NADH pyrophosphatase NudC (nudix superfamily)
MSAAQDTGTGAPDAQEYAGELGGFVLARSAVDRVSARRGDTDWLAAAWEDPGTRVLVLDSADALVRFGDKEAELVLVPPAQAPDGLRFLLGVDDAGVAYFGVMGPAGFLGSLAADAEEPAAGTPAAGQTAPGQAEADEAAPGQRPPGQQPPEQDASQEAAGQEAAGQETPEQETPEQETPEQEAAGQETPEQEAPEQQTVTEQAAWLARAQPGLRPAGLREAAALLNDRDAGLFTHAVALANWHATHTHCPRCGTRTLTIAAGHAQRCPADGSEHFPRVDPAVIMLVTDPDDRCLLARNRRWPERRVSILAGFVEPGESAEQAVAREVEEETAIVITRVRYVGSQPWPMPQSLMLGFRAEAAGDLDLRVDEDEIAEAHWYSREELRGALAAREILLPPPVSIAHRLIESWYGEELPGVW